MKKDRNLLFGMLAISMKKVRPDKLAEIARQTQTGSQADLGQSLVDAGLLSHADKEQLDSLVEMSLKEHDGDASATIQDFGKHPDKITTMVDSLDDFLDAFERNAANKAGASQSDFPADSLLGNVNTDDAATGHLPVELDSLLEPGDMARTRITHSGNTNDKGSVGDIARGDAPDSFFQSLGSPDTQIMSPVQAAAELDESQIVPAVAEHKGRYETIREFAKGGMGQITLVHDTHLGRDVALKQLLQRNILPETRPGAPTTAILTIPIIARFLQEARVTGQLEHPSIIPVYELGYRADGSLYYTMKLIRGQSMHDFLKEAKDIRDRLTLLTHFLNLCQAISYAHSRGVIHRDLKPMNIMIGEFGETVLIDWGIAKIKGQDDIHAKGLQETFHAMRVSSTEATAKTMYGQTIGSPYFMPAEQAMGRTDLIDERSDIYSLGAVLYVILTGQMPYAGNNVREFMGKVGQVEPRPVRELEPLAPPELAAIVRKAMALVPENRYQSAKELTDEIQRFLSGGNVSAYDYSLMETAKRLYKKHKVKINVSIGAAAALIIFGVIYSVNVTYERNRADAEREVAVQERAAADVARGEAEKSEKKAKVERDNAQQQLYYANIANTKFNINEQQMGAARQLLASPETASRRQWEWGHMEALTHADLITVERGGRFVAFTGDGNSLITGTKRGSLSLHDLKTGVVTHEFVVQSGNGYAVAASSDVSRIAVRGDKAVWVWDVNSHEELFKFDEPTERSDLNHYMDLSGNGAIIAALNSDNAVRVWDVASKQELMSLPDTRPNSFNVALNTDGTSMVLTRQVMNAELKAEHFFELYETKTGKLLGSQKTELSAHDAAFSPDGVFFAVAHDKGLELWDVKTFKKLFREDEPRFNVPDVVSFSPDNAYLAAGDKDGGLTLMNTRDGASLRIAKAHEDAIRGLRFDPSGKRVLTVGDDRTARLWTVPDLRPLHVYKGHESSLFGAAFNADATLLATTEFDGVSKIWDLQSELEFAPVELEGFERVTYNAPSGQVAGGAGKSVIVWNAHSGYRTHTFEGHETRSKSVAFNLDGTLLASAGLEGDQDVVRIWNLASGALENTVQTGQKGTVALAFARDNTSILVESLSGINLYERASGTAQALFASVAESLKDTKFSDVTISANGSTLAAVFTGAENRQLICVEDLGAASPTTTFEITAKAANVFFSPDGLRLHVGTLDATEGGNAEGGSLYTWNISEKSLSAPEKAHDGRSNMTALVYAHGGNMFATASMDATVIVWDAATLKPLQRLTGHASTVRALDFSPNDKRIVTGSDDKTFKIWDVATGKQIFTVQDAAVTADLQVARPTQVAFSPDGLHLATITEPPVSPMILHAFSIDTATYPVVEEAAPAADGADEAAFSDSEKAALQLEKQLEAYKRLYWRK